MLRGSAARGARCGLSSRWPRQCRRSQRPLSRSDTPAQGRRQERASHPDRVLPNARARHVRTSFSTVIAAMGSSRRFVRIPGRCSRASANAVSGATVLEIVLNDPTNTAPGHSANQNVRVDNDHFGDGVLPRARRASLKSFTSSSSEAPLAANRASSWSAAFRSAARSAAPLLGRAGM